MNPRLTPLTAALSVAFLAPAHAQTADLDPVIVSATRFSEADTNVAANVSVITRDDGKKQWAYKGKPLYYWIKDQKPGDRSGDGFSNVWRTARP